MVQIRSRLEVADNTGARMATMIGVIGKATLYAGIGDVITANVKEASATGTVKKGVLFWFVRASRFGAMTVRFCVSTTTRSLSSTRI
jgi:ribosomal protein L14